MPDDPWFDEMDPMVKLWLYESWCQDLIEENEFAKNYSIFVGSFSNPEMAKEIMEREGGKSVSSSEKDFEKSIQWMLEDRERHFKKEKKKRRIRQRRVLNRE